MAIHFKTTKERLDYLKGKHEEIIPVEVKIEKTTTKNTKKDAENEGKPQKTAKKGKKND